jgi:cysteine desulfuration protein SufE
VTWRFDERRHEQKAWICGRVGPTLGGVTIAEKEAALFERFGLIPDSQERLSAVVHWASRTPRLPLELRHPGNRVPGCVSPVWMVVDSDGGKIRIRWDADSPIVKGLLGLLCEVYDGAPLAEVVANETDIFEKIGLLRDLSTTRRNGMASARWRLREIAAGLAAAKQ